MRWYYQDIPYSNIEPKKIKDNDFLFYLIVSASFIEITSDVYEKNLSKFYQGDEGAVQWLKNVWEIEEIQHGEALRTYINHVWEDFNWDAAYRRFLDYYLPLCTPEEFQDTRAKEMLARMVVETGTSTFYKALERYAEDKEEPVLAQIAHNISKDEVYHYDMFEKIYDRYNEMEKLSKEEIVKVIYHRLKMVDAEDGRLAYRAIYEELHGDSFKDEYYEEHKKRARSFAKEFYPYKMAIKMLLRPLHLNKTVEKVTIPVVQGALKLIGI